MEKKRIKKKKDIKIIEVKKDKVIIHLDAGLNEQIAKDIYTLNNN